MTRKNGEEKILELSGTGVTVVVANGDVVIINASIVHENSYGHVHFLLNLTIHISLYCPQLVGRIAKDKKVQAILLTINSDVLDWWCDDRNAEKLFCIRTTAYHNLLKKVTFFVTVYYMDDRVGCGVSKQVLGCLFIYF